MNSLIALLLRRNMEIVDIHSHILPGVDDGSKNMDMTRCMIEKACRQGITVMFATPHFSIDSRGDKTKRIVDAFEKTQAVVKTEFPQLKLVLGSEIYMEPGMIDVIKREPTLTLNNTRYVLCEFSFGSRYEDMYNLLQQLVRARYKPVLAHVERFFCLRGNMDKMEELRKLGVCMQINAESLQGSVFDKNTRYGKSLIKNEMIDFIGTDAHDMERRSPELKKAADTLVKLLGENRAQNVLSSNAKKLLL